MLKKILALALASAAFVSAPAQAAVMFKLSGVGFFGGCEALHPSDLGPPKCYERTFDIGIQGSAGSEDGDGQPYVSVFGQTLIINMNNYTSIKFRITLDRPFQADDLGPYSIVSEPGTFERYRDYSYAGSFSRGTVIFEPNPSDIFVIPTIDFSMRAVPEPTTWAMMIAGFGLAGAALRTRRKAAPALPLMQA